jgi:hypothetical protein
VLADIVGLFLFLLGVNPATFGLDRSRVIGYVQAIVFLLGLGLIVLVSYVVAALQRRNGEALSLVQDIGGRLMATGYVLAAFSSVADLIGLGSEPLPRPPHFGLLQSGGLLVGVLLTLIGLSIARRTDAAGGLTGSPPTAPSALDRFILHLRVEHRVAQYA